MSSVSVMRHPKIFPRAAARSRTPLSLHRGVSSSSQPPAGDPPPCGVPPNISRTVSHRHSSRPVVPPSRADVGVSPCGNRVATPGGHDPRQAVASLGACHGSCSPTPCSASAPSSLRPRRKQVFGRQSRPGAEESLARRRRLGSIALIAARGYEPRT